MPSRSTLVSEIQQLLTGERADPRAAQLVFLIPVLVELLLHLAPPASIDSYFVIVFAIVVGCDHFESRMNSMVLSAMSFDRW